MRTCGLPLAMVLLAVCATPDLHAALTVEQKRELTAIRKDLATAARLTRQKKYDEATKLVDEAEKRLEKVATDAKLNPRDITVTSIKRLIQTRRAALARAQGKKTGGKRKTTGVSYERVIAPILKAKCAGCHSNKPKGGVRLDSEAGIRKVITPGNYRTSLLVQRIVSINPRQRMPKNGPPLSLQQRQAIALWIQQGAKFGNETPAKKGGADTKKAPEKITIPKPTGSETVSFKKDIAPFMVNLCVRCHNDQRKGGGLSLTTFEDLMVGGKSGRVLLPGNLDGSRLWDLVGKQKPFKMPRGQARITRTNWRNLQTWIKEGARFDGEDAKATLRSLVPTEGELKTARFAKMSAEEFARYRRKRTETLWDRAFPKQKPKVVETKEFIVFGNVSKTRLEEVGKWADKHAEKLRKTFRDKTAPLFKGKLAVIVLKDRFGYEEFNLVIQRREVPREMTGHAVVDKLYEDAYIVVQDLGNDAGETSPGMQVNLIDHLTGAYLMRGGGNLPDWVLRGSGLALAAQVEPKNGYITGLRAKVPGILKNAASPAAVLANGTFSPADVGPVGYTLVEFILRAGGGVKYGQFIARLHKGESMQAALKAVYQTDPASLARTYARNVSRPVKRSR
jgi:mono/diheme cytochrome c family protein